MVTTDNPRFFSMLGRKNAPVYEAVILRLYDEMYRDVVGNTTFERVFIKNIIIEEIIHHDIQADEELSTDISIRAGQILSKLEDSGWVLFKFDKAQLVDSFTFTSHGRKFAQTFYEASNRNISTRMRNVRSTLNSIRAYEQSGDPYDLMDAKQSSEYVVSDMMDRINEINDARKEMVYCAMDNTREAGEKFFDYLEKEFHKVAVSITEDSAAKHYTAIHATANILLDSDENIERLNRRILSHFPQYRDYDSPVEEIVDAIVARVKNACDIIIPEIYSSIKSFTRNSEIVLRQANAIKMRSGESAQTLANIIKETDNNYSKEKILNTLGASFGLVSARMLDPERIKIRTRMVKEKIHTVIEQEVGFTEEELRRHEIKEAIRKAFGYTSKEIEAVIMKALEKEEEFLPSYIPIDSFKQLLIALNIPAVAAMLDGLDVEQNELPSANRFFEGNGFVIKKKGFR